jgi:hypothetical protein
VLLTTLDSTAVSVRRVWFQTVNANAVFTIASHPTISQPRPSSRGQPSSATPAA